MTNFQEPEILKKSNSIFQLLVAFLIAFLSFALIKQLKILSSKSFKTSYREKLMEQISFRIRSRAIMTAKANVEFRLTSSERLAY